MNKNLMLLFISLVLVIFLLPSCHILERKEAKNEEAKKEEVLNRGIASVRYENPKLVQKSVFVRIPAGKFLMGSPANERYRQSDENDRDGKQVEVVISKAFMMMATEVTQAQFFQLMKKNPSYFKRSGDCDNWDSVNMMCPDNPVERVSWNEAQRFIKKLNEGLGIKGCKGVPGDRRGCYRLPTETEWEWAVKGNSLPAYFFGDGPSRLGRYAIYRSNSGKRTHKVRGNRSPNRRGLYDVYGNVWEWVQDAYQDTLTGGKDPLVVIGGNWSHRVLRGGSWYNDALNLRSAFRFKKDPEYRFNNIGFRLVRTL